MNFTIYQVIEYLNNIENRNKSFSRVGDHKFKIFKGSYGDLMMELGDIVRPLPIFNYIQDRWNLEE